MRDLACVTRAWILMLAIVLGVTSARGDGDSYRARLDLVDGSFVEGHWLASQHEGVIRWQSDAFRDPLDFELGNVRQIVRTAEAEPAPVEDWPQNEFAVDLNSGDRIFGLPVNWSGDELTLKTSSGGQIRLDLRGVDRLVNAASQTRAVHRATSDDPGRRVAWKFDHDGKSSPSTPGDATNAAELSNGEYIQLDLPSHSLIEVEIDWEAKPQFDLAIGVDHSHAALQQAARLAIWDGELVLVRELDDLASLVSVLNAEELKGLTTLRLLIELDRAVGRIVVRDGEGKRLATLASLSKKRAVGSGVRILTSDGTRLLHVASSAAAPLRDSDAMDAAPVPRVETTAGEVLVGEVSGIDQADRVILIQQQDSVLRLPWDQVESIVLVDRVSTHRIESGGSTGEPDRPLHRALTTDGGCVQGEWLGRDGGDLVLRVPGARDPIRVPLARLESLRLVRRGDDPRDRVNLSPRLIAEGVMLRGSIAEDASNGSEGTDSSTRSLWWKPDAAVAAVAVEHSTKAEIRFRPDILPTQNVDKTANPIKRVPAQPRIGGLAGVMLQLFERPVVAPQPPRAPKAAPEVKGPDAKGPDAKGPATETPQRSDREAAATATLFLITGDTVTCEINRIDERGIEFTSSTIDQGFARHDQIKSVILAGLTRPKAISEATRDRLLMIPRARSDDPPTHLICSRTGDFLRGRLLEMDDESLRIEIRLETRVIPRDRVAQIIWLHRDPNSDPAPASDRIVTDAEPDDSGTLRVQAIRLDDTRLTFDFTELADGTLIGHNEVVGQCSVRLTQIDRLLLGDAIEHSLSDSPLAAWRPRDAVIPRAFLPGAEGGEGSANGTQSAMVGKMAPEFEIELLGGEKFRLADNRGRVLVLDFWASWCGPCIQAMPQIEEVVSGFADQNVQLLAVNLQEMPEKITAALERMDLNVTVGLDRTGGVAEQYGVTAIPQTVIIGPDGTVARLYIGIQSGTTDDMRLAIASLIEGSENAASQSRRENDL